MKKIICIFICFIIMLCALCGCQKTPEEPIVIGKHNDGWKEEELPVEETVELGIPETYKSTLQFKDLTVQIDAEVECPEEQTYPIYVLEKKVFTQEDADKIIDALIGDRELYSYQNARTKEYVKGEIEYYTRELNAAQEDGFDNLIEAYQGHLKELMEELETAPKEAVAEDESRILHFNQYANDLSQYAAEEIIHEDGRVEEIWTREARKRAEEAGNNEVTGRCRMPDGSEKLLSIKNRADTYSTVFFGTPDGEPWPKNFDIGTEKQALDAADELMKKLGIDYEMIGMEKYEEHGYYKIVCCSRVEGTNRSGEPTQSALGGEYAPPLVQEEISIWVNSEGFFEFRWDAPIMIRSEETENVRLLPWEEISAIIEKGLKVKKLPFFDSDYVVGRRLEVEKILLHYMQVPKEADNSSSYYIPVWDVLGTMYSIYDENYDSSEIEGGGFLVDENHEYMEYENETVLTINAIDGTIVR